MDLFKKKKKKSELEDEIDNLYDVDQDSDIPVSEKKTKQKKIRTIE